jgi:hypothetical protein
LARPRIVTSGTRRCWHNRAHGGFSQASLRTSLRRDRSSRRCVSHAQSAPSHGPGPVPLRHDPGPALWPQQCRRRLGPPVGCGLPHSPLALPGVLAPSQTCSWGGSPVGPTQVGPKKLGRVRGRRKSDRLNPRVRLRFSTEQGVLSTSYGQVGHAPPSARYHRLLRSVARLDPQGRAIAPVGLGPGGHRPGRPLHGAVDRCRVPWSRRCRRLEGPAGHRRGSLEARAARPGPAWPGTSRRSLAGRIGRAGPRGGRSPRRVRLGGEPRGRSNGGSACSAKGVQRCSHFVIAGHALPEPQ